MTITTEWLEAAPADEFWTRVARGVDDVCWYWRKAEPGAYGSWRGEGAHRVALALTVGPPPEDKPLALHSCDNPSCVNPSHLRWGDNDENMADLSQRGPGVRPARAPARVVVELPSLTEVETHLLDVLKDLKYHLVDEEARILTRLDETGEVDAHLLRFVRRLKRRTEEGLAHDVPVQF